MSEQSKEPQESHISNKPHFKHKLEASAILTIVGIIGLFSTAIIVTQIAPHYVDNSWTSPSSRYQVQMQEISDPNIYIAHADSIGDNLNYVHHLKNGFNLLAFKELENVRFVYPPELEKYITREEDPLLKLTSRLLLLRIPEKEMEDKAKILRTQLENLHKTHENKKDRHLEEISYQIFELYDPAKEEAFSYRLSDEFFQDWTENFVILEETTAPHHQGNGVMYVPNPQEYLVREIKIDSKNKLEYDPQGRPVKGIEELLESELAPTDLHFHSRKKLIADGEHIYAIEGCWYCHTDQTRTLIQDVVLNGVEAFPAPPSSPNEYIYQKITFPGTRRIGPDLSRTGIKRPSRDWHMAHFWDPQLSVKGSIMPTFRHFFDPNKIDKTKMGTPNYRFEAIYQYMMTKGTRITSPVQGWWIGKDPVNTKEIIEGL